MKNSVDPNMTQIISMISPWATIVVADRLVSILDRKICKPFDELANKLIIYRTKDAIVTIAYAGQAYTENKPTDEWVAGVLTGIDSRGGPAGERKGMRMGFRDRNWDIGFSIENIRREIPKYVGGHPVFMCVSGFKVFSNKRFVRPILWEMKIAKGKEVYLRKFPRIWPNCKAAISVLGVPLSERQKVKMRSYFDNNKPIEPHLTADFLASVIQLEASYESGIGQNISAVIMPIPGKGDMESKFIPKYTHYGAIETNMGTTEFVAHYHPWVISSSIIAPPSLGIGTSTMNLDGIKLVMTGYRDRDPPSGIVSAWKTVPRKPAPKRV